MKKIIAILTAGAFSLSSGAAFAVCERNVDNVEIHYINGMFTDPASYHDNLHAIEEFLDRYFTGWGFDYNVSGSHNRSKQALIQVVQVARHKFQDANARTRLAIMRFLNNDPKYASDPESVAIVQEFLHEINVAYQGIMAEQDTIEAKRNLVKLLDTCSRVLLMTHSQGNFYGNALFNDLYANYVYPNGYPLAQYPMLGTIQIASPVYIPGGAAGTVYPETVGHVTNDNDIVMLLVRASIGAVGANYDALYNPADRSGHSLELSYLKQPGQAETIAGDMSRIIFRFKPYPLHGQHGASSSAMLGFGFSGLSKYLDIQFTSGAVYRYDEVSPGVFDGLRSASSQGGYFNEWIRDFYTYLRLE